MFEFTGLADMKGWMRSRPRRLRGEPPGSVVISSRVRLGAQPRRVSVTRAASPRTRRTSAASRSSPRSAVCRTRRILRYSHWTSFPALERRILFERNLISQGYSMEKHRAMVLSAR